MDDEERQELLSVRFDDAGDLIPNVEARAEVASRIMEDEEKFVVDINTMVQVFLQPLRESVLSVQPILSQEEIKSIFSTIEVILSLNSKLLSELQKLWKQWPQNQGIGEVFLEMAPYVRLYGQYIDNFEISVTTLSECARKQPAFS